MLSLDALRSVIRLLEEHRIRYYVFGGIALDGIRARMTREHGDLDLYVHAGDLERFRKIMGAAGHHLVQRENMYFSEHDGLKVGVVVLSEEPDHFISRGNKTLASYPKRCFASEQYGMIDGMRFRIAPNEVLAFESQHSRFPEDKLFGMALPHDPALFSTIGITVLRASRT